MKGTIREQIGIFAPEPEPEVNLVEKLERSPHPDADKFDRPARQEKDYWTEPKVSKSTKSTRSKRSNQKSDTSVIEPAVISKEGLIGDLLWVYCQWGGKETLLQTIKEDRDLQRAFVRELLAMQKRDILDSMKVIETSKKSKGPGARKFTFVVKGLYDKDVALPGKTRAEPTQIQEIDPNAIEDPGSDESTEFDPLADEIAVGFDP